MANCGGGGGGGDGALSRKNPRFGRFNARRESSAEEKGTDAYVRENLEGSLAMLSEELDALGIEPIVANDEKLQPLESSNELAIKLIDASWKLIREHRSLMRKYDRLNDIHSKISNDNSNLKSRVERLKEELRKRQSALCQSQERERRLAEDCRNVARDLRLEKELTVKLRKQSRSKDNQHEHELRRAAQNGHKLRERLEKSMEHRGTRSKEKMPENCDDRTNAYEQTILRLQENNRVMLEEIEELRDALALHSAGIELHVEASGIWTDTEIP